MEAGALPASANHPSTPRIPNQPGHGSCRDRNQSFKHVCLTRPRPLQVRAFCQEPLPRGTGAEDCNGQCVLKSWAAPKFTPTRKALGPASSL